MALNTNFSQELRAFLKTPGGKLLGRSFLNKKLSGSEFFNKLPCKNLAKEWASYYKNIVEECLNESLDSFKEDEHKISMNGNSEFYTKLTNTESEIYP